MNSREAAIAKLQQLSEPSLEKANQLLDSLLKEQHKQNSPSPETFKAKWEKWFAQVDQLEVSSGEGLAKGGSFATSRLLRNLS